MQTPIIHQVISGPNVDRKFFYFIGSLHAELEQNGIIDKKTIAAIDNYIRQQVESFKEGEAKTPSVNIEFQLFINYCSLICRCHRVDTFGKVWKSKNEHDYTPVKDGFYLGIGIKPDEQIRYWYPMSLWDMCDFAAVLANSPEDPILTTLEMRKFLINLV